MKIWVVSVTLLSLFLAGSVDARMVSEPVGKTIKTSKGVYKIASIKTPDGTRCTGVDVDELKADLEASPKRGGIETYYKKKKSNGDCVRKCKKGPHCCMVQTIWVGWQNKD